MRTTVELPDDLFRQVKARAALQGRSLKDLVADGLKLVLSEENGPIKSRQSLKRGSAGAWARKFAGIAKLAPGETTDDVRMSHYQKKYGL
jgi:plasmid stability protein